jgi:hypothetical protein
LSGGKTITDNELESLEKDFGLSKTNTQEDFKNAVRYLYDINQKRAESTWDTFGKFTDGITPEGTIKPPEKIGEVDKASKEVKAQKEMTKQDKFLALMEAALSKRDSTKSGR